MPISLERLVERVLWASRFVVLVPVLGGLLMALAAFYLGTADVVFLLGHLGAYTDLAAGASERSATRATLVGTMIRAVDVYLLAAILLIFALGLYELFIGRIAAAEREEVAPRLLLIRSIDDLKNRLAKVVLLIEIVEFLQVALDLHLSSTLDLLYLAVGIALIGAALYLTNRH